MSTARIRVNAALFTAALGLCIGCADAGDPFDSDNVALLGASLSCGSVVAKQSSAEAPRMAPECAYGAAFEGTEWVRSFTASKSGSVVVSAGNYDSYPFVTILRDTGAGVANGTCVAANYYSVRFDAVANEKFFVVVQGVAPNMTFDLKVECGAGDKEMSCDDGFDNDNDYLFDCYDPDCDTKCVMHDKCQAVSTLSCGQLAVAGSTGASGSTDNIDAYDCAPTVPTLGREIAYEFVATKSGPVLFDLTDESYYASVAVLEKVNNQCNPTNCVAFQYYQVTAFVEAGKSYYVVVDRPTEGTVDYKISAYCQ